MPLFNDLLVDGRPDDAKLRRDLQGNVLTGFPSLRSRMLFVRFPSTEAAARSWVQKHLFSGGGFTVSREADRDAQKSGVFANFLLSAQGLRKLGCPENKLNAMDEAFLRGARAQATLDKLTDPEVASWDRPHKESWDALLLVACDDGDLPDVERRLEAAGRELGANSEGYYVEVGSSLDQNGLPATPTNGDLRYESFGYRDNLSTFVFSDEHAEKRGLADAPPWNAASGTFQGGAPPPHDPRRPLSAVLTKDPLSPEGFGTYFVFRKLEQEVDLFNEFVESTINQLLQRDPQTKESYGRKLYKLYAQKGVMAAEGEPYALFSGTQDPPEAAIRQLVKARIMGRAPDGTPAVADAPFNRRAGEVRREDFELHADHTFNYDKDRAGGRCPFAAHVRAMNHRSQGGAQAFERDKVLVRRGIPYGQRGEKQRGLLFLCAQRNITEQFEFVQQGWANGPSVQRRAEDVPFGEPVPMADNVIGRPQPTVDFPKSAEAGPRYARFTHTIEADYAVQSWVTLKAGEYFFAPSLSGLQNLVTGTVLS